MYYAFQLGRESELCFAELLQVLAAARFACEPVSGSDQVVILKIEGDVTPELFHRCGGLVKYAKVEECGLRDLETYTQRTIEDARVEGKRLTFGVSVYPGSPAVTRKMVEDVRQQMYLLGMTLKSNLKAQKASARFVTGDEPSLSSVVVEKNRLTKDGVEAFVVIGDKQAFVGRTIAVQDFEAFAQRDMGRPVRDDVAGMLPPKLARMLVNLAGLPIDSKTVVLDPFCGSGTVVQEALLLGAGKVLGSDASDTAVAAAQTNIDWLRQHDMIAGESRIEQVDVTDVGSWLPEQFVDVVATEPFLGDPVRGRMSRDQVTARQKRLAELYDAALAALAKVVKPEGRVVILFPVLDERNIPLPRSMGKLWRPIQPWSEVFTSESKRGGLLYRRPGQRVGREIFVLVKK